MAQSVEKDRDIKLVRRAVEGDHRAFELLVRQYQGRVAAVIARLVNDPDKVRDLTQEAFIRAYRSLATFRGEAAFYTWLYRIAVNMARSHLLTQNREVPWSDVALEIANGEYTRWQEHDTPEQLLLRNEMLENLEAAIENLAPSMRKAILLRDVRGLPYGEIASLLGCPVGTVRSRIFRGRQEIVDKMQNYLENHPVARCRTVVSRSAKGG